MIDVQGNLGDFSPRPRLFQSKSCICIYRMCTIYCMFARWVTDERKKITCSVFSFQQISFTKLFFFYFLRHSFILSPGNVFPFPKACIVCHVRLCTQCIADQANGVEVTTFTHWQGCFLDQPILQKSANELDSRYPGMEMLEIMPGSHAVTFVCTTLTQDRHFYAK